MKLQSALLAALLVVSAAVCAHYPHDVHLFVSLSPDFGNDGTAFLAQNETSTRPPVPMVTHSGGHHWDFAPAGFDNTSNLTSITASPDYATDDTVYVTTANDGLFRSVDGGHSWARHAASLPTMSLRGSAAGKDIAGQALLFVSGMAGGLYRSYDGGATWQTVIGGEFTPVAIALSPQFAVDGTIVVSDIAGDLHVSTDHGLTFASLPGLPAPQLIIDLALTATGEIFAGTTAGLFRSVDGGQTLQQITSFATDIVYAVATSPAYASDTTVFATTPDQVYRSDDAGATWTALDPDVHFSDQTTLHFLDIKLSDDFANDGIGYLAAFEGLFHSSDGGDTWHEQETRPPSLITGIAMSPDFAGDGVALVATDGGGLYVSADHGSSWTSSNRGVSIPHTYRVEIMHEANGSLTLLATQKDFSLLSTDGGANWTRRSLLFPGVDDCLVSALDVSPAFATDRTFAIGCRKESVILTTDAGASWRVVFDAASLAGAPVAALAFSPDYAADATLIFATSTGRFMRSRDGGASWQQINNGMAPLQWFGGTSVAFSPAFALDRTLAAATSRGAYLSHDGGDSWSPAAPQSSPVGGGIIEAIAFSPDFATDGTIVASVRGRGAYRSVDAGASWESAGSGVTEQGHNLIGLGFSPTFATDRTILAWSNEHLVRSSDGGTSFQGFDIPFVRHEDWRRQSVNCFGNWVVLNSNSVSSTTIKAIDKPARQCHLRFWGTGVSWIGIRATTLGIADVYIDREFAAHVDQYAAETLIGETLFTIDGLPLGEHEIHVVVTADRNPQSSGNWTTLDAFDVQR